MQSATWSVAKDAKQGKAPLISERGKKHGSSCHRSEERGQLHTANVEEGRL